MKYYIDFSAQTAREFSDLYLQIHLLLKNNNKNFAVSFPGYTPKAGEKKGSMGLVIRLLSHSKVELEELNVYRDIIREGNNSSFTAVLPVPENIQLHAVFSRSKRRTQSHLRRIAKRSVAFGRSECEKQLFSDLEKQVDRTNDNPCVTLRSLSTKQRFPLHIAVSAKLEPQAGQFCSYGLSPSATVPIF